MKTWTPGFYGHPRGDKGPEEVLDEVEASDGGFKLGPHDGDEPDPDGLAGHADADRWRLVNNGRHGTVLGVFFDATSADEWFTSDDDAAKVSALPAEPTDDRVIIAWGFDSVFIMDEEGQPQIE